MVKKKGQENNSKTLMLVIYVILILLIGLTIWWIVREYYDVEVGTNPRNFKQLFNPNQPWPDLYPREEVSHHDSYWFYVCNSGEASLPFIIRVKFYNEEDIPLVWRSISSGQGQFNGFRCQGFGVVGRPWEYPGWFSYMTIEVDINNRIRESNETNNLIRVEYDDIVF